MESTRRVFLGSLAALAASTGLFRGVAVAAESPDERVLRALLGDLAVGEPFHADWTLADAYPRMAGGVPLVISDGATGRVVRVDVCRRADPPRAPAYTDHLELIVMDGGGGVGHLEPALHEALWALAKHLSGSPLEARLARGLLTHEARLEAFEAFMKRASSELAPTPPA